NPGIGFVLDPWRSRAVFPSGNWLTLRPLNLPCLLGSRFKAAAESDSTLLYRNPTTSDTRHYCPCAGTSDGHDGATFVRCNRDAPAVNAMIGLVLVTHGRLAVEFRAALEHVVGPQSQIEAITIDPEDDVEERRRDIIAAVKGVDSGDGVAILTDMFGGTPSNLAISVMSQPKVEVLAGINLPMLVKLAKVRDECPLAEAVAAAQEAGRKYVTIASRVLNGK